MGRERPLAGAPYHPERSCQEAQYYFDHIDSIDKSIAAEINSQHHDIQVRHNRQVRSRTGFEVGDLVWLLKPKPVGGHKTQTWWVGPVPIVAKRGAASHDNATWDEGQRAVHISQLKPYIGDPIIADGVPLHHYRPGNREAAITPVIEGICAHRYGENGTIQFLTRWEGAPPQCRQLAFHRRANANE